MPTLTIDVTTDQATRIATACGKAWGLKNAAGNPRAATLTEIRKFLIDQMKGIVIGIEKQAAIQAVAEPADLAVL